MATDQTEFGLSGLAQRLKQARGKKRLSQRALGEKVGAPQSHISKIESGAVDIKASSLIEIARALDLEIMLVPRSRVPAVEALSRSPFEGADTQIGIEAPAARTELNAPVFDAHRALEKAERDGARAARALGAAAEMTRLAEAARELTRMQFTNSQADQIRDILKKVAIPTDVGGQRRAAQRDVQRLLNRTDIAEMLREASNAADGLKSIRNALAHGALEPPLRSLPAYRLSDGDDDA